MKRGDYIQLNQKNIKILKQKGEELR